MTLRLYTKLTCFSVLALIFAGSLVTSTGSGLSVPDWPLSFGMVFPPMVGGVLYEHGHRMIASAVGFMVLVLALWLWRRESRGWVRMLGWAALGTVILQGVLGGITVLFFLPLAVSVSHAVLAQAFFILTIIIAYSFSREFERRAEGDRIASLFIPSLAFTGILFLQLLAGALMRHTHAGLAIPDFPRAAGEWIPAFNESTLHWINEWRFDHGALSPVTLGQVEIHFVHRAGALAVAAALLYLNIRIFRSPEAFSRFRNILLWADVLVVFQIFLGGLTVLSGRIPVVASLHVLTGAGLLGIATLMALRSYPAARKTDAN